MSCYHSSGEVHPALLDTHDKVLAEYVWLGGNCATDLRSKTKVLDFKPSCVEELPVIMVDASAAFNGQAAVEPDGEVYLKPRKLFRDPFRGGDHILVLCDTFKPPEVTLEMALGKSTPSLQPHPTNTRALCESVMKRAAGSQPMFAVEQEYLMVPQQTPASAMAIPAPSRCPSVSRSAPTQVMLGEGSPAQSTLSGSHGYGSWAGPGACMDSLSISMPNVCLSAPASPPRSQYSSPPPAAPHLERDAAEAHLRHCLAAGIQVTGLSQGPSPHRWSYKVGPCRGSELADQLWMSRYLLMRVGERHCMAAAFELLPGCHGPGLGCFVKFSCEETRLPMSGIVEIQEHLERLQANHIQHLLTYGKGCLQQLALTDPGALQFSCGLGSKHSSISIPTCTVLNRGGYYVDRRPSAAMDPYLVCMMLASTTLEVPLPCGPSALEGCSLSRSAASSSGCPEGPEMSDVNSEDVLLDELDRMDGFTPETPHQHCYSLTTRNDDFMDECDSDGTSPETSPGCCDDDAASY